MDIEIGKMKEELKESPNPVMDKWMRIVEKAAVDILLKGSIMTLDSLQTFFWTTFFKLKANNEKTEEKE